MEENQRNPWNVGSFDDFLYYCCPECDEQYELKEQFISHAFDQHPKSKSLANSDLDPLASSIEEIDVKEELNHDLCDVTIAGILTESQINQLHESVTDAISTVTTEELKPKISKDALKTDTEPSVTDVTPTLSTTCEASTVTRTKNVTSDTQCTKCGHVCESENALITHIIGFHAGMKNLQPCCSLQNSKEEFMLHIMGHADANDHAIKPQSQQKFTIAVTDENKEDIVDVIRSVTGVTDVTQPQGHQTLTINATKTDKEKIIDGIKSVTGAKDVTKSTDNKTITNTAVTKLTCCFCNEVFEKNTLFSQHVLKKYSKDGVFQCHTCNIVFSSRKHHEFMFHMTKRHNLGVFNFVCKECGHAFRQNGDMVEHTRNFEEFTHRKKFLKKKCEMHPDIHFTSRCELIQHNNKFHPELVKPLINCNSKEFKCEFCDAKYFHRKSLDRHSKENHPEMIKKRAEAKEQNVEKKKQVKYKCTEHQQEFSQWHWLKHKREFHPELTKKKRKPGELYECKEHFITFTHRNGLWRHHLKYHPEYATQSKLEKQRIEKRALEENVEKEPEAKKIRLIETVVCEVCGKSVKADRLEKHMKIAHDDYVITEKHLRKNCEQCGETFNNPLDFENHLHLCLKNLKEFPCKFCDTKWVSHLSLELHLASEHKKLVSACDICGHTANFWSKSDITLHKKRVHEKKHDHICHLCGKTFFSQSKLQEHLGCKHGEGEPKYKCDICDNKYWTATNLATHKESAHSDAIYPCELCDKTFKVKNYLQTHIRIVHEKYRPHKCDICQEAYLYKRDLIKHKSNIHHQ